MHNVFTATLLEKNLDRKWIGAADIILMLFFVVQVTCSMACCTEGKINRYFSYRPLCTLFSSFLVFRAGAAVHWHWVLAGLAFGMVAMSTETQDKIEIIH